MTNKEHDLDSFCMFLRRRFFLMNCTAQMIDGKWTGDLFGDSRSLHAGNSLGELVHPVLHFSCRDDNVLRCDRDNIAFFATGDRDLPEPDNVVSRYCFVDVALFVEEDADSVPSQCVHK